MGKCMSTPKMELLDLPNEVLQGICNQLDGPHYVVLGQSIFSTRDFIPDSPSLAKLCLVCRRLRDMAQPVLFRNYHRSVDWNDRSEQRLFAFTVAVARNPRLASYVRTVDAAYLQPNWDTKGAGDDAFVAAIAKERLGFPSEKDLDGDRRLYGRPKDFLSEVVPALLLLLCPNLEELKVDVPDLDAEDNGWIRGWPNGPWRDADQVADPSAGHRRKLALGSLTLDFGYQDSEEEDMVSPDLALVAEIVRCSPQLRQLRISNCLCLMESGKLALGNLTLLHLHDCGLDPRSLRDVLEAAARLETFSYTPFGLYCETSEARPIGDQTLPREVFEALAASPSRETLLHLSVDFHCPAEVLGDGQDLTGFLAARPAASPSSRFPFPRLQTLVVSDGCLYGPGYRGGSQVLADALPAGMRTLEVVGVQDPLRPRDDLVRVAKRSSALELPEMRVISVLEARGQTQEISTEWGRDFGYESLFDALEEETGDVARCHYYQQNINSSLSV
ncbi:hypothetical protein PpBr36_03934 [Pyricularia pennisetigena]|uniref:hypothetical protein n=1 Tax=Pyricularia pennisetigena TaxID=1578925 RepID=UPI0011504AC3|nr:hypothetical protein PpBr36_03934 [Pyricularia pennisetigena]TLS30660.1 hypothetical protein PpBr36_03934 [Pyricularia pennisetigena]